MFKFSLLALSLTVLVFLAEPARARQYKLGLIHAEQSSELTKDLPIFVARLQSNYSSTFSSVTVFNANLNNITYTDIQGMDLVLVWSDWTFFWPTLLGDGLGQFIDAGGGVVLAFWASSTFNPVDEYTPLGEFAQKYEVLIPTRVIYGSSYHSGGPQEFIWSTHPILAGINNITTEDTVPLNVTLTTGSYVVARYNQGSVLAAVKDSLGPKHVNRVDLALWPLAPIGYTKLPFDYMQYDQLIVQSLLYTLSTPYLSVANQTVCDVMPDVGTLLNGTFGLPPSAVVTQSISIGAALGVGTYPVNVTVTDSGSTIVTSVIITANNACNSPAERPISGWFSLFSMLWAFTSDAESSGNTI